MRAFAEAANEYKYMRPVVDESTVILKINGRCDASEAARLFDAVKKYLDL